MLKIACREVGVKAGKGARMKPGRDLLQVSKQDGSSLDKSSTSSGGDEK